MPNSSATCDGLKRACFMKKLSRRRQYSIWETIEVSRTAFQGILAAYKPVKKQKYIIWPAFVPADGLGQMPNWTNYLAKCQIGIPSFMAP
jgi:hypothetical protein